MKAPIKKEQKYLDPKWLRETAAIAMKRGTALIFSKTGLVYGIVPKSGGSINVFYQPDAEWVAAVLARFPEGAVFPDDTMFGGANATKALRPYASIRVSEKDGKAWIDDVTGVLHVKGVGAVVKSAAFAANENPVTPPPDDIPDIAFDDCVTADIAKLLVDVVGKDEKRPALKRILGFDMNGRRWIGATDAKSAMAVQCEGSPEEFSFDPLLVPISDIVGFRCDVDDVTGFTVRHYRLSDGTTLSERLGVLEVPNLPVLLSRAMAARRRMLLTSASAQKLVEAIDELGICAQDKLGGIVKLSARNTEVLVGGQVVAEFDVRSELGPDDVVYFSMRVLTKLVRLGGDIRLCDSGSPAVAENGSAVMIAMPAKLI